MSKPWKMTWHHNPFNYTICNYIISWSWVQYCDLNELVPNIAEPIIYNCRLLWTSYENINNAPFSVHAKICVMFHFQNSIEDMSLNVSISKNIKLISSYMFSRAKPTKRASFIEIWIYQHTCPTDCLT